MGKRLHWAGVLLFLCSSQLLAAEKGPCDPWVAKIASVQGNVEAKRTGDSAWSDVTLSELFCPGDQIRVGDKARAAIVLSNETLLRLNQNSAITLSEIDKDGPSLLELLKGIGHFISRVPRSLKVNTPFVNAAIEGTEFVVAVKDSQTAVTVFEGIVLTENQHGQLRITQNETAIASADTAPHKALVATPRDAVQWALYFPPIFDQAEGNIAKAQDLLYAGQVDAAREILKDETGADALSLQAIIAVVANNADSAMKYASDAVAKAPQRAAARIALSYAQQAQRDLTDAMARAKQATELEANNALAWARLAELQLSTGELDDALASATRATELNPNLSRTQTILGFAYLLKIRIDAAKDIFYKAIELDQVDPLPRLGLGLAKIRDNQLAEGRREIEIAASLDPNNSVIRSYLGKAYFEEKRSPLDAEQFAMAKELDPNDPTPWFYDAIRKQTENDPVGALEDLNKSIELNDNRAVYRSSLQLDQDEAARSVSLARVYQDLGFEQIGLNVATKSLSEDPTNSSALRFLSDIYSNRKHHEIARASALLQSQLLQPLSAYPVQPHVRETNLGLAATIGPNLTSLNEFNSVFSRNQTLVNATAILGSNNLVADELVLSGVQDRLAYSFGQFSYNTDGYRANADVNHDIRNAFFQYQFTNNFSAQLEYTSRNTLQGDLRQSQEDGFNPDDRRSLDEETGRVGLHYAMSKNSDLLFSYFYNTRVTTLENPFNPVITLNTNRDDNSNDYQLQYTYTGENSNLTIGGGVTDINGQRDIIVVAFGTPGPPNTTFPTTEQENLYAYYNYSLNRNTALTIGVNYHNNDNEVPDLDVDEINPKLGLIWNINHYARLRLAAFENIKRALTVNQTLEPTQLAGFNQFYDDFSLAESKNYGVAFDGSVTSSLNYGFEYLRRELRNPSVSGTPPITTYRDQNEDLAEIYTNWTINRNWQTLFAVQFEEFDSESIDLVYLKTISVPISLQYFHPSGFYSAVKHTYVKQNARYTQPAVLEKSEQFNVTDLIFGYRLPKRQGIISLSIRNIFDNEFLYQDLTPYRGDVLNVNPEYIPDSSVNAQITLNF